MLEWPPKSYAADELASCDIAYCVANPEGELVLEQRGQLVAAALRGPWQRHRRPRTVLLAPLAGRH
jgi:hypothetical protein